MANQLGVKSRVFIDVLTQLEFGTNKMTCKSFVEKDIEKELWETKKDEYMKMVAGEPENLQHWLARCKMIDEAYNLKNEAKQWLVDNGYLKIYEKKNRNGVIITFTGVTKKGWEVAPKYLALIK